MYDESLGLETKDGKWMGHGDHVLLRFQGALASQIFASIQSANQYVNIGLMLKATVCRFSSMANNTVAPAPLVAVVGATGTGKSEVSLDFFFCIQSSKNKKSKNRVTHIFK